MTGPEPRLDGFGWSLYLTTMLAVFVYSIFLFISAVTS